MVRLSVSDIAFESLRLQAWCRARCAHGLSACDRVDPTIDSPVQMANCCAHLAEGSSCRLLGCVVWFTVQLAATCFAVRRLVRREIASSDVDLHWRVPHASGGGRCLRRSRAARAWPAQLLRVRDGHGTCCGRSGGGRVRPGGIYSPFKVVPFSFAF